MRGIIQEIEIDFDEAPGERPAQSTIEQLKLPKKQSADTGVERVFEAMGTSLTLPVPYHLRGKRVRVTMEEIK